jgi:hypothetical protein
MVERTFLCGAGLSVIGFKIESDVFSHILHGTADEYFSRDLYPHELGGIDTAILRVGLVDIKTYGAIRETEGVESSGVGH